MDSSEMALFLASVLFASYWQSVTGFAMGMLLMAVLGGLQVLDIARLTAVVSLLSLANACLALRGRTQHIDRAMLRHIASGLLPSVFVGVWLLTTLHANATWLLELLLGVFVTVGSVSMALQPDPIAARTAPAKTRGVGIAAGVVGGMFSASGPVLGWFVYRQPMPLDSIRATLLSCFALTTGTRTIAVGLGGGLTSEVLQTAALGFPVVVLGTWLGRRYGPPLAERTLKRIAFAALIVIGVSIAFRALR